MKKDKILFYSPATPPSPKLAVPVLLYYAKFKGFFETKYGWWIPDDNYTEGRFYYYTSGDKPMLLEADIKEIAGWAPMPDAKLGIELYNEPEIKES